MEPGSGLHFYFLYDEPLPNRYAASIQIIRTGIAIARAGHRFTFLSGPHSSSVEEILRLQGATPTEGFTAEPFFPSRGGLDLIWRLRLRLGLSRLVAATSEADERAVLMTRGATGNAIIRTLAAARQPGSAGPLILQEMHCLQYLRRAEKEAGHAVAEDDLSDRHRRMKDSEREATAAADALVCLTDEVAEAVQEAFGIVKPQLILPSGTSLPEVMAREHDDHLYDCVYAGKIEKRKGVYDLCDAFAHLSDTTLALAGGPEGAVSALDSHLRENGLSERVQLKGFLPPGDVEAFLLSGRIGACPMAVGVDQVTDRFTSPMKLLQMMSLGMPVVATDTGPVRRVATHEHDALLVAPCEPRLIAQAIGHLLNDQALAARIGAAARKTAEDYSWDARARKLIAFAERRIADGD